LVAEGVWLIGEWMMMLMMMMRKKDDD